MLINYLLFFLFSIKNHLLVKKKDPYKVNVPIIPKRRIAVNFDSYEITDFDDIDTDDDYIVYRNIEVTYKDQ